MYLSCRFQEVLNCLGSSHGFDIRGRIKARMLSPNTTYAAYLVYKVGGRGLFALRAVVRAVDNESDNDAENRCAVVHVIRPSARYQSRQHLINATLPVMRDDGWSEIELGSFWNDPGHQGEVEARLMQPKGCLVDSHFIIEVIEFRPYKHWMN